MPRPFPGVDPYVEDQGRWPDFHGRLLLYCGDLLSARMPGSYVAQMEEHVYLVEAFSDEDRLMRPDVAIARDERTARPRDSGGGVATLQLAPVSVPLATEMVEDERARWLEIRRLPDMRLVTVIELLSPSNKSGIGRERYLEKRLSFIAQPIHFVELDLLSGGQRLPMRKPMPKGDYYALVSRAENRPLSDVYAWSVRDKLPTIPIPLLSPDPDILVDLAPLYDLAYQNGRYGNILKYDRPLDVALDEEAMGWVKKPHVPSIHAGESGTVRSTVRGDRSTRQLDVLSSANSLNTRNEGHFRSTRFRSRYLATCGLFVAGW